jgi:sugar O-acyltransferase (sialic acid O-acetyltransferase NeuD family)
MTQARPFGAQHPKQNPAQGERVVIVGTGDHAAFAFECFTHDSPHQVVAFTTEPEFLGSGEYCGLPVIPFDQLAKVYPPDEYQAFVAVSAIQLNRIRSRLYAAVKTSGFQCVSYVSRSSFVWNSAEIGENVFIGELNMVHHKVRIGNNVVLASGTHIGHGSVIGEDCYLASCVALAGDCHVGRGSFLGIRSCIANNHSVATDCVIGAGAVVVRDTQCRQVYVGNPARPTGRDSFDAFGVSTGCSGTSSRPCAASRLGGG